MVPVVIAVALVTFSHPPVYPGHEDHPPSEQALAAVELSCPAAPAAGATLLVAQSAVTPADVSPAESGVSFGLGAAQAPLALASGGVLESPLGEAGVIVATGSAAPGLVGSVATSGQPAATNCAEPSATQWFGGLGAGPTHASELELVNPDRANAVADVTVFSEQGIVDVPQLRGVAVPAESHLVLKLAELLPQRGQLSLEVTVSRGRLGVHVLDRSDELGEGAASADWSPPQAQPAKLNVLVGLPSAGGQHKLVVTNPGQNVALVSLRVSTPEAAFAPAGLAEVQIPPESVAVLAVTDAVNEAVADAGLGLLVESSEPVAAVLRSITEGDLSFTGSGTSLTQGLAVLPSLNKKDVASVVLGGGPDETSGTVRFLDQSGAILGEEVFTVPSLASKALPIPQGTRSLKIDSPTGVTAALVITGKQGAAIRGVLPLVTATLVPDVRPTVR